MNTATSAVPNDTRTIPLQDRISDQARQLWENYGRPHGRDVEIWLEAERQVLGADSQVNAGAGAGAVAAPELKSALTPKAPRASTPDGQARKQPAARAKKSA